jgi:hypothetical protein
MSRQLVPIEGPTSEVGRAQKEPIVHNRINCPSCSMNASRTDHRQFPIVASESGERRRCRNCGEVLEVVDGGGSTRPLASA